MSLDVAKLEKVRELAGGIVQARCPACAEGGNDRSGEHLRIYPDGKFGCCVHPKDSDHRKRIWALVGRKLRLSPAASVSLRLKHSGGSAVSQSVKAGLTAFDRGTLGTGKSELENGVPAVPNVLVADFGTLGTGNVKSRAHARVDSTTANIDRQDFHEKLEDLVYPVPSVPVAAPCGEPPLRLPFLTAGGTLVIPFDSPERYHWWRGGQSVAETLSEVRAALATNERMNLCR